MKLFDLLETLYSSTTTALAGHELETFVIELGVRQGGSKSPLLFNLYIDYVMRVFMVECARQNVKFVKLKYSIPNSAFISNLSQKLSYIHNERKIVKDLFKMTRLAI